MPESFVGSGGASPETPPRRLITIRRMLLPCRNLRNDSVFCSNPRAQRAGVATLCAIKYGVVSPSECAPVIFISHIHEEGPIASVLRECIIEVFGDRVQVFVSSDGVSIPGGENWFDCTIDTLRRADVVLVLISSESNPRRWINFEAGVGFGTGASVVPIAIADFTLDKLPPPLAFCHGRPIEYIEGVVFDIVRGIEEKRRKEKKPQIVINTNPLNKVEFLNRIQKAEAGLIRKAIAIRPRLLGESLTFDIENQGNTDVELLHIDIFVPIALKPPSTNFVIVRPNNALSTQPEHIEDHKTPHTRIRLTALKDVDEKLEPVLTPSMGIVNVRGLQINLNPNAFSHPDPGAVVYYQVHARNYRSERVAKRWVEILYADPPGR